MRKKGCLQRSSDSGASTVSLELFIVSCNAISLIALYSSIFYVPTCHTNFNFMLVLISYINGVISYIGGVIFSYVGLNVGRHNSYMSVLTHPVEHTCDMYYVMQFNGCTYLLHRRCYLLHLRRYLLCILFLESLPPFQLRRANPHSANHGQQGKSAAKSRERSKIYRNRNVH